MSFKLKGDEKPGKIGDLLVRRPCWTRKREFPGREIKNKR